MATTIKLKNGSGAPLAGDLVAGEPALDLTNKRLYTEDSGGTVIEVGTNPTSLTTGTFTSTGIDDNATSTAITIDSDGDVGIGLASPLFQAADRTAVTINGTSSSNLVFGVGGSANTYLLADSAGFTIGNTSATLPTMFYTNGSERMRIDSSGNVGIGVTPDAWASPNFTALQIGVGGSIAGRGGAGTGDQIYVSANAYYDGTSWDYIESNYATSYYQDNGTHVWRYAASGTADAVISWSEAMRIDSSGRTLIGTTSADQDAKLTVVGSGAGGSSPATISTNTVATFRRTGGVSHSANVSILGGSTGFSVLNLGDRDDEDVGRLYYDHTNNAMLFDTNAAERMRIDSSGRVGIGTSDPSSGTSTYYDDLVIKNATSGTGAGITIQSNTTNGFGAIEFRKADGTQVGKMYASNADGQLAFETGGSERMRIDSSGNVGIGTSSPGNQLHVVGGIRFSSSGADAARWNVYWNSTTGDLIVVSSDARLKKDFDYDIAGIETVNKLKPVRYTWKENNKRQLGFTAQESLEADEHLAWHDTESDQWGLDGWEGYAAVLTKAIQEQQAMIEELKAEVAALKGA